MRARFYFLSLLVATTALNGEVFFKDDFQHLRLWVHEHLPGVDKPSKFRVSKIEEGFALSATSEQSASFIHFKESFNPYHYARLRWRWRVHQLPLTGNAEERSGDDFAMRISVVFKYDPQRAGFFKRAKYSAYKTLYGEYPPDSSLHYVWANRKHKVDFMDSAYTDRVKMIFVQNGVDKLGTWIIEEIDVMADYKKCFGEDPPEIAEICILCDSDNTLEATSAQLDWIELSK